MRRLFILSLILLLVLAGCVGTKTEETIQKPTVIKQETQPPQAVEVPEQDIQELEQEVQSIEEDLQELETLDQLSEEELNLSLE